MTIKVGCSFEVTVDRSMTKAGKDGNRIGRRKKVEKEKRGMGKENKRVGKK